MSLSWDNLEEENEEEELEEEMVEEKNEECTILEENLGTQDTNPPSSNGMQADKNNPSMKQGQQR
jgi:hypothetical protein